MRLSFFILLAISILISLPGSGQGKRSERRVTADTLAADSIEYELIVLDPGFETWLLTQPPKTYLSKNYYEFMNRLYVSEWNYRYSTAKGHEEYDSYIDYNSQVDYGLDLNYTLYYYFRYFEDKHNTKLVPTIR